MTWEKSTIAGTDENISRVIKGCLMHRDQLEKDLSNLPFPQNSCCFNFKVRGENVLVIPLPLNLLYTLWDCEEAWHGKCAHCQSKSVYGLGCGGMVSVGGVTGHCIKCHQGNFYWLGGLAATGRHLSQIIENSKYEINSARFGGCFGGPKLPLHQALMALGYRDLPDRTWLGEAIAEVASLKIAPSEAPSDL